MKKNSLYYFVFSFYLLSYASPFADEIPIDSIGFGNALGCQYGISKHLEPDTDILHLNREGLLRGYPSRAGRSCTWNQTLSVQEDTFKGSDTAIEVLATCIEGLNVGEDLRVFIFIDRGYDPEMAIVSDDNGIFAVAPRCSGQ